MKRTWSGIRNVTAEYESDAGHMHCPDRGELRHHVAVTTRVPVHVPWYHDSANVSTSFAPTTHTLNRPGHAWALLQLRGFISIKGQCPQS
jgi:hypothetical protein